MLKEFSGNINRFINNLITELLSTYDYEVSIYLGNKVHRLNDLAESRIQSLKALEHRYYYDSSSLIEYRHIKNSHFNTHYEDLISIDNLVTGIFDNNSKLIEDSITEIIDIFTSEYLSSHIIYMHLNRLLNIIIEKIKKLSGNSEKILESADFIINRDEHIYLNSLTSKLTDLSKTSLNSTNELKNHSGLGEELKRYIDMENLSLKWIADKFSVNSAYLGQVFKKNTGASFNSYLHDKRLTDAAEKLIKTSLKVYEIAESVGYTDVNYFMKKFENIYGITPKKYRDHNS